MKDIYCVYLLKAGDTNQYKIGYSKRSRLNERVKALQTGNANDLEVVFIYETKYGKKLEQTLHRLYYKSNLKSEWFALTEEQLFGFLSNCAMIERNFDATAQ